MATTKSLSQLDRAVVFAATAHAGQRRKFTGEPYIVHPLELVTILLSAGVEDEALLASAVLHDTVEDTDTTIEQIETEFGSRVATLVGELTKEDWEGNRAYRRAREVERLATASRDAKTIKLADVVSNTANIVERDAGFAKLYLGEARPLISEALRDGNPALWQRANHQIETGLANIGKKT